MMTNDNAATFQSSHLLSDVEILNLGIRPSDVELYRRKHYQAQFGIDTWYYKPELQKHTFRTAILPLSYDEGQAIVDKFYNKKLSSETVFLLQELTRRLNDTINKEFPHGAFIKLNTRSPKDATLYDFKNDKIQQLVIAEMHNIPEQERNDNTETISFLRATTKAMVVTNGIEALKLLTTSSRISEDLNKMLPFPKELFNGKLIIREWLKELPDSPQGEFRGFVHNNNLNAITQYYSFCYFDELSKKKQEYQKRIMEFFDCIKIHFAEHSSYVIDFFVASSSVYIIEINPFHAGAGAMLFSWKENRELFLNGPFEFRIVEHPKQLTCNPKEIIPKVWQRFINDKIHPKQSKFHEEEEETDQPPRQMWWLWTATFLVITSLVTYRFIKHN